MHVMEVCLSLILCVCQKEREWERDRDRQTYVGKRNWSERLENLNVYHLKRNIPISLSLSLFYFLYFFLPSNCKYLKCSKPKWLEIQPVGGRQFEPQNPWVLYSLSGPLSLSPSLYLSLSLPLSLSQSPLSRWKVHSRTLSAPYLSPLAQHTSTIHFTPCIACMLRVIARNAGYLFGTNRRYSLYSSKKNTNKILNLA